MDNNNPIDPDSTLMQAYKQDCAENAQHIQAFAHEIIKQLDYEGMDDFAKGLEGAFLIMLKQKEQFTEDALVSEYLVMSAFKTLVDKWKN